MSRLRLQDNVISAEQRSLHPLRFPEEFDPSSFMETLSTTYLEEYDEGLMDSEVQGLFGLFQVDLDNYIKVKFAFMYHMQIPPEQIDNWPYWEYEDYVELLSDVLKKKQNAEKDANANSGGMDPNREASKFMKGVKMPSAKLPNMPKFR